jgi:hypothetical protein
VLYRVWTTDWRARHGLQGTPNVGFTCLQQIDSLDHILPHCRYAKEVWFWSMRDMNLLDVTPSNDDRLEDWWMTG